jgi:coenzyme F420-reducing hydrogenase gamma subunit
MGKGKDKIKKPRIGIFKYSCCAGCQFQFLYFQEHVLEALGAVEIIYCKMESSGGVEEGPFDIALIEGAITESKQVDQLKMIRERSRFLIPIGSCAVNGGVVAIKDMTPELEVQRRVYNDTSLIHSMRPHAVDAYVKVDGYVRGCPMGEKDLLELLSSFLLKKEPVFTNQSVCVECKLAGNICLLVAYQKPCMGPVTNGGCGALCPSKGRACYGCWGPMEDANAPALARKFERIGLPPDEIVRKFTQFASITLQFRKGAEIYG